jgi:carboxyl-terminal processing protease
MKTKITFQFIAVSMFIELTSCWGQNNIYLNTFEVVWKKLNETYYDSTFGGLNWKEAYDRYLPQISTAENDEEYYRLVNRMLWELKVSHTNLVPPGRMALSEPLVCAEGSPGFDIRLLNGVAVVTSVRPRSPAGEAGLRPGYVIHSIDEMPVEQIVQEAESSMRPPYNLSGRTAIMTKAILGRVYGASGTEVTVSYSDEKGQKVEKKLLRTKRSGVAVGPNGILYLAVDFEVKRFDNGIGYMRLNTFQPPLTAQISAAIKSLGDVTGIILDIRGNSGGEIEGMPDLFLPERKLLYLRRTRKGETKVFIDPAEDAFSGQLVLLVDQLSGSASELFAGSLQAAGRAVVIGERSTGAVMESDMMIFPTGAIFMYPVAQVATPDGKVLEGHGVAPDIEVGLDREMLLKGVDSQIDSAIRYLEKKVQK